MLTNYHHLTIPIHHWEWINPSKAPFAVPSWGTGKLGPKVPRAPPPNGHRCISPWGHPTNNIFEWWVGTTMAIGTISIFSCWSFALTFDNCWPSLLFFNHDACQLTTVPYALTILFINQYDSLHQPVWLFNFTNLGWAWFAVWYLWFTVSPPAKPPHRPGVRRLYRTCTWAAAAFQTLLADGRMMVE